MRNYEAVIGLEVHAQLQTQSKMFCGCSAAFGAPPNTLVCPVCLGLPGALPVLNRRAVEYAVRVGVATECTIAEHSIFARKNYFYPDCPKDYQISQYDTPLCRDGYLWIEGGKKRVGITRIHLEEDAGKLVHAAHAATSNVDMNRSGVPLIEIVSEPDMRTAAEASEYLQKLRSILRYLKVCDGNMEEGSLRCDVNLSVRRTGEREMGTKTEVKNLNSFKQVEQALAFEFERQVGIVDGGGRVAQDTLLWDPDLGAAALMRSKEHAHDYRYLPEPDLRVLTTAAETVRRIASELPELPDARRERFVADYGIPAYDADVLTASRDVADYYEATAVAAGDNKAASNWVMGEVLRELKERRIDIGDFPVPANHLGELVALQSSGKINSSTAKAVLHEMMTSRSRAADVVAARGLEQINDDDVITTAARQAIAEHPEEVARYLAGREKLLQFFVGQVMKAMRGKANPQMATDVLKKLLDEHR